MEVDPITFALFENEDNGQGQTYGNQYIAEAGEQRVRVGFLSDDDLRFMRSRSPYGEKYPELADTDECDDD